MTDFRLIVITAPTAEEGRRLAEGLVTQRLAACVTIVPVVESLYRWEGAVQKASECLLLCKSDTSHWEAFQAWVTANHSYTVPEIVQLPIESASAPYLNWLTETLQK